MAFPGLHVTTSPCRQGPTANHGQGKHDYMLNVDTGAYEIVGKDVLTVDGHCSFTRDRKWFLTDTYPDENDLQTLKLWNLQEERELILGRFYSPLPATSAVRCDLHPRWDRDDAWVSFDSVHQGTQVYVLDAGDAVHRADTVHRGDALKR